MPSIRWLPEALDDLQRLHAFIEQYNPDAAKRAVTTLIDAVDALADFPEKGKPWDVDLNIRELPVRFGARGYVIRYRYVDGVIVIVRAWHTLEHR